MQNHICPARWLLVCTALAAASGCTGDPSQPLSGPPAAAASNQVLSAYYTWYQDPGCQDGQPQAMDFQCPAPGTACPTTLLEVPAVKSSAIDFVILFFVSPHQSHGLQLGTLVNGMQNQTMDACSAGYCDPPAALVQGISAAHEAGQKVILSLLPGSELDTWGPPFAIDAFAATSQKLLAGWDLDGFDMDCEPCAENIDEIFAAWAGLTPNPGRGVATGAGGRRPYLLLTAETYTLPTLASDTPLDLLQLMNGNYSADAGMMLENLESVRRQWAETKPEVPILLGVKPGTTSLATLARALESSQEPAWQQQGPSGWMLFNISRDAGCLTGSTGDLCNPPTGEIISSYPALATCTAYGQYGLTSPPTGSFSLLDCLTGYLESGDLARCN